MDQMRSVFLVGFMGVGASIPEIFAVRGEPGFRSAERDELTRWVEADGVVVATGGGAFCCQANRDLIHRSGGISVFLDLPW
jgi:shikimate kinase